MACPFSEANLKSHVQAWNSGFHWSLSVTGIILWKSGTYVWKAILLRLGKMNNIPSEYSHDAKVRHTLHKSINLWDEFTLTHCLIPILSTMKPYCLDYGMSAHSSVHLPSPGVQWVMATGPASQLPSSLASSPPQPLPAINQDGVSN